MCTKTSRLSVRPTHPPVQWISTAVSVGVKWLGYEAIAISLTFIGKSICFLSYIYICILNFLTK
jgi:hypothetical protein